MIGLVKPLIENKVDDSSYVAFRVNKISRRSNFSFRSHTTYVAGFGTTGAKMLVPLRDSGLSDLAIHYLYDEYQQ